MLPLNLLLVLLASGLDASGTHTPPQHSPRSALGPNQATLHSSSSPSAGTDDDATGKHNETFTRLDALIKYAEALFGNLNDNDTPGDWQGLESNFKVKKHEEFCVVDNGDRKCWTPTEILQVYPCYMVRAYNKASSPSDVILHFFTDEQKHGYEAHVQLGDRPNIVKLIARGSFEFQTWYGDEVGHVVAMEVPDSTIEHELTSVFQDSDNSMLYKKCEVRSILSDVVHAFLRINGQHLLHGGLLPWDVFLFRGQGSTTATTTQLVTAKLANFAKTHVVKDQSEFSQDITDFGSHLLEDIIGALYHAVKRRHPDTKWPCLQPHDAWTVEVCDIVMNLDRISRLVQNKEHPLSLEEVLADDWMKGC